MPRTTSSFAQFSIVALAANPDRWTAGVVLAEQTRPSTLRVPPIAPRRSRDVADVGALNP
jgi:hypothetical protein